LNSKIDPVVGNKDPKIFDLTISSPIKESTKRKDYEFEAQGYNNATIIMNSSTSEYLKVNNAIGEGVFNFVLKNDEIDNAKNVSSNFNTYYVYIYCILSPFFTFTRLNMYI
jgi:hypothetical protein